MVATFEIDAGDRYEVRAERRRLSAGDSFQVELSEPRGTVVVQVSGTRAEIAELLDEMRIFLDEAAEIVA